MTKVVFLSHGGGPLPLLGDPNHIELIQHLRQLSQDLEAPKQILVISAHWEASVIQITHHSNPPLLYDYYGFPEQSYHLDYPVPGSPALAEAVQGQLRKQGIAAELEQSRGLDHGVFVPLMLMYPNADIPCIQVSLQQSLDPLAHLQLGQALASLDQEGLLILCSGFSFHNMQAFFQQGAGIPDAKNLAFETWLKETLNNRDFSETERWERLRNWERAPNARYCHPREEHLLPLLVCYGAAQRPCKRVDTVTVLGKQASFFIW